MKTWTPLSRTLLLTALLLTLAVASPAFGDKLVVPVHDAAGAVQRIYLLDLADGQTYEIDPRRSGEVFRFRRLTQNLFAEIGRVSETPGGRGEFLLAEIGDRGGRTRGLLLVETPTGFMASLSRLGEDARLGELRTFTGRPGMPVAAEHGGFTLLPHHGPGSRRDSEVFLFNTASGACLRLQGLGELEADPRVSECAPIQPLDLRHPVVELEDGAGVTLGYLLLTGEDGEIHRGWFPASAPAALEIEATDIRLAEVFAEEAAGASGNAAGDDAPEPGARRFALAPLRTDQGGTVAVLAVDTRGGRLALIRGLGVGETPSVVRLRPTLSAALSGVTPRGHWIAVPRVSGSGSAEGVWLLDSEANRALLVMRPLSPEDLTIQRVEYRN